MKRITDVPTGDLHEDARVIVNDQGAVRQVPVSELQKGSVKTINGTEPDEDGNFEFLETRQVQFVDMSHMRPGMVSYQGSEPISEVVDWLRDSYNCVVRIYRIVISGSTATTYNMTGYKIVGNEAGTYNAIVYHGDNFAPAIFDAANNKVTLDPDWVAPAPPIEIDATLTESNKAADAKVVGEKIGELYEEKIDKNGVDQVTKDNADFIGKAPGANLFNKDTMVTVASWFVFESGTSGEGAKVVLASNQYTGQYAAIEIPITNSGDITIKMGGNVSLYAYYFVDDNNITTEVYATAIGASIADGYTVTAPDGAKKLLLSLLKYEQQLGYGNELMVNYGAEALEWEAYTERYVLTGVDVDDPRTIAMSSIVGNENNIVYIHMAEEYALVVGDTFELFYKGIISAANPDIFDIRIICDKGNAFTKRYIWTPTDDDIGAHNLTVELYGINHNLLHKKTVKLVVKGKASSPSSPINVLCVGDSLTAQGIWPAEVHRRLTASMGTPAGDGLSNINFVGSMDVDGVGYEGHAGWSITSYTTAKNGENPFWDAGNGKLDFAKYAAGIGASSIDYLYLLIGWNDADKTQDVFKTAMHEFIMRVRLSYPNVKVVLMGLEIPARDGLGENYGAKGAYADYHGLMQFVFNHWKWINDFKGTFTNTVSTLNIAGQFDTEHNMPTATRPVNARNAEIETYQNNGVHPANAGYMQIADAVYRDLTHKLQS